MLTDFGVAKIVEDEGTQDSYWHKCFSRYSRIQAPEQVTSKTVDKRVDIYHLELFSTRDYWSSTFRSRYSNCGTIQDKRVIRCLGHHCLLKIYQVGVEHVLMKALSKKPEDRYQNMDEFFMLYKAYCVQMTILKKLYNNQFINKDWIA